MFYPLEDSFRVGGQKRAAHTDFLRGPDDVWAMDFVHDQLATGRKLRILTVVDTYPRPSAAVDLRLSYCGENVVATMVKACRTIG